MTKQQLPPEFIAQCEAITAKRPRTVIQHILQYGSITTEELKERYGYNHPPRAASDVRECGIPLKKTMIKGNDDRRMARYEFDLTKQTRYSRSGGCSAFGKNLKLQLIALNGSRCEIYQEPFADANLQIDHRIPYEVAGDDAEHKDDPSLYMLLCGSANRAKSWSCEHCVNWLETKDPDICRHCYWAYPDRYDHIAMLPIRRVDIVWTGSDVEDYERLKEKTAALQRNIPDFIKEIIKRHI